MTRREHLIRAWRLARQFTRRWDRDRWELVTLSVPLTRCVLFAVHLAPPQLDEEVVQEPWQIIMLSLLGAAALLAIVGVMRQRPIVERAGLHVLGPLSVLYGIASVVSTPGRGSVTLIVYGMIAACCIARATEITKSMRIVNRVLEARTELQ